MTLSAEKINEFECRLDALESELIQIKQKLELERDAEKEFVSRKMLSEVTIELQSDIKRNTYTIGVALERTESVADKLKSFRELQQEIKSIFSFNGYSALLRTNSSAKKLFYLAFMLALFSACLYFAYKNISGFQEHNVVTQIKIKEKDDTMDFPAVTICLQERRVLRNVTHFLPRSLDDALEKCLFDKHKCSQNDFHNFQVYQQHRNGHFNCYQFNGGRNASNHEVATKKSKKFGTRSGLEIHLNYSVNDYFLYFVGDQKVRDVFFCFFFQKK